MAKAKPDGALNEQQIQKAVFANLKLRGAPDIVAWHPFSGGYRKPKEAAIFKSLGAIAGLPDVMVLHQGRLHCLELKTETGKPTETQLELISRLDKAGAYTAVCYGLDRALACLEAWGLLKGRAA